jgi:uncharacterized protein YcsI (UPF0317 family)
MTGETSSTADLAHAHPAQVRRLIRDGGWDRPTTGLCLGYLQANLVILPRDLAGEFQSVCEANPRPMPLLDVTEPGDPHPRRVAPEADLRTDLPRYRVYRSGELTAEPTDVRDLWREDLVGFLLGCSFTAEGRLLEAGVRLRHLELGRSVPMWRTSLQVRPAGRFRGPVVVSMRPIRRDQLDLAQRVTAELPLAHGAPLHVGDPEAIGIHDLARPDWGDAILPLEDEVPVFWACGVTPQALIASVRPEFAITHAPGHMFITDVPDAAIRGREPALAALVP